MQINLLPDLVIKRRHEAQVKRIATLALAGWIALVTLVLIVMFLYSLLQHQLLSNAQNEKNQVNAQVNSDANVAFRTEALSVQASLKDLSKLYQHQERFSLVYDRIAQLLPKQARLQSVILTADNKVQLAGTTDSYLDTGKLVASFKNSSTSDQVIFSNVLLNGANLNGNLVSFSLTASFAFPANTTGVSQ